MIADLARTAVHAASADIGRDVYRNLKKGNLILLAIAAGLTGILGFRLIGMLRSVWSVLGGLALIFLGLVIALPIFVFISALASPNGSVQPGMLLIPVAVYLGVCGLTGLIWGHRERAADAKASGIEHHNISFMLDAGFSDLGVGDDLLSDPEGNTLKLKAQEPSKMVFMVVGRRNMRAAIELDPDGRMTSYTGLIKIA